MRLLRTRKHVNYCIFLSLSAYLQEEVNQVGVLFEFGTDYAEKLDLFILCRSSQNLATQTDQFLWKSQNAVTLNIA